VITGSGVKEFKLTNEADDISEVVEAKVESDEKDPVVR
jgi:hypothetical protein